jgi:hypothetical protein
MRYATRKYVVRRQEDRRYSIWDTETDRPAEAEHFDEALDFGDRLNRDQIDGGL